MSGLAPFFPPQFKNIGKSNKDLFKKSYTYDHQFKALNAATRGLALEHAVVAPRGGSGDLRGYAKVSVASPQVDFGTVDAELHTDAAQESKIAAKFTKLTPGLIATLTASSKAKDLRGPSALIDLDYSRNFFSASVGARTNGETHKVDASAVVGADGFSVGAQAAVDASNGAQLGETNVGVELRRDNVTASVWTENDRNTLVAGYFSAVSKTQAVGAQFKYDLLKQVRSIFLGHETKLDADTVVKTKAELSTANTAQTTVGIALEHRLANPQVLVGVATSFRVGNKQLESTDFGVSLTVGDY